MDRDKKRPWSKKLLSAFTSKSKDKQISRAVQIQSNAVTPPRRCGVCFFELPRGVKAPAFEIDETSQFHMLDMPLEHHIDSWHRNWDFSADFFRQSAARGCVTCARFSDFFSKHLDIFEDIEGNVSGARNFKGQMRWDIERYKNLTWKAWRILDEHDDLSAEIRLVDFGSSTRAPGLTPQKHDHPAICDDLSLRSTSTKSEEDLKLLKTWLHFCNTNHGDCTTSRNETTRPKRLLHISQGVSMPAGERYDIILTESAPDDATYVCLSHCWGKSQPLRLLKSNQSTFQNEIPWLSIPQTFRDAMMVSMYLGIPYIWIDSLCIVQDDSTDWQVEASKMLSIYENSYITIAATASGGSSEGLFYDVPQAYIGEQMIQASDDYDAIFVRLEPDHEDRHEKIGPPRNLPLMNRGWVFQERLVPPRTIHFTAHELVWECREMAMCQCHLGNSPFPTNTSKQRYYSSLLSRQVNHHDELIDIEKEWANATKTYSSLQLTFHSDRLIAISGIAKQFANSHGPILGEYLAGIWANSLPNALLWTCQHSTPRHARPSPSYAPTWSWSSVASPIQQAQCDSAGEILIEVISTTVTPIGPDIYGQLKACHIRVRGYAIGGVYLLRDKKITINGRSVSWAPDCLFEADETAPENEDWTVVVLKVARSSEDSMQGDCMSCLVLRCVDAELGYYERLGVLSMAIAGEFERNKDMFDVDNRLRVAITITLV